MRPGSNREVTIASGATLVRQALTFRRERKPDALDFDEQKLMSSESVLNMMFRLSIKTVIVLSGFRTIVVPLSTGLAI